MPSNNTVHVAIELSSSTWLIAARLPGTEKSRLHRVEGGDSTALLAFLAELRQQASTRLGHAVGVEPGNAMLPARSGTERLVDGLAASIWRERSTMSVTLGKSLVWPF